MASERVESPAAQDEPAEFVLSFVDDSQQERTPMEEIWDETETNFLVRPFRDVSLSRITKYPLAGNMRDFSRRGKAVLKDPETHQEVMTIASKIALALFPEEKFTECVPVGLEDVFKASVGEGVLDYVFRLPNHYRTLVMWIMSAGIYGKGIIDGYWRYEEGEREARTVGYDMLTGQETSTWTTMNVPIYDDIEWCHLDVRDFFPDPGGTTLDKMAGAAKRFRMNGHKARALAAAGLYDPEKVEEAIAARLAYETTRNKTDDATTLNSERESHPAFLPMLGFEYYGRAEYKAKDSAKNRRATILNGITVADAAWPRRLPFFDLEITPRLNSFWGIAPAEIIRYDQDFADMLKMMLADAVVRSVHPPFVYRKGGEVDYERLKQFRADVPIGANDPRSDIAQLQYNPPVAPAFSMYSMAKDQMRQATGALGVVQGLGLGVDRASATEAQNTFQQALDRPELFAKIIERTYLPPLAKYTLELYKNTLDSTELAQRIGESEVGGVVIADLMGDFDVKFVGSRVEGTRQEALQSFREIISLMANPAIAPLIPIQEVLKRFFRKLGAHEIAAMVADPQIVLQQLLLQQMTGANPMAGNGNGTSPSNPPLSAPPAQIEGASGGIA